MFFHKHHHSTDHRYKWLVLLFTQVHISLHRRPLYTLPSIGPNANPDVGLDTGACIAIDDDANVDVDADAHEALDADADVSEICGTLWLLAYSDPNIDRITVLPR